MIRLYKDGDEMAVSTDAKDEDEFIEQMSAVLEAVIHDKAHIGDWAFQFRRWLPAVVEIACAYRGYKTDVVQRRFLCSSTHKTFPTCWVEAYYENGNAFACTHPITKREAEELNREAAELDRKEAELNKKE